MMFDGRTSSSSLLLSSNLNIYRWFACYVRACNRPGIPKIREKKNNKQHINTITWRLVIGLHQLKPIRLQCHTMNMKIGHSPARMIKRDKIQWRCAHSHPAPHTEQTLIIYLSVIKCCVVRWNGTEQQWAQERKRVEDSVREQESKREGKKNVREEINGDRRRNCLSAASDWMTQAPSLSHIISPAEIFPFTPNATIWRTFVVTSSLGIGAITGSHGRHRKCCAIVSATHAMHTTRTMASNVTCIQFTTAGSMLAAEQHVFMYENYHHRWKWRFGKISFSLRPNDVVH